VKPFRFFLRASATISYLHDARVSASGRAGRNGIFFKAIEYKVHCGEKAGG